MKMSRKLQFGDEFLEEINKKQFSSKFTSELKNHIADKFAIDKFTTINANSNKWIEMFEKECIRFDVTTD